VNLGEGYRLLSDGERIEAADEAFDGDDWRLVRESTVGCLRGTHHFPMRRKVSTTEAQPIAFDPVTKPKHYVGHPSGVECIQITEHMNFCRGNAIKYIWRAGDKGNELEDLKKARWYIDREIERLEKAVAK
jgi:hypothetical protein